MHSACIRGPTKNFAANLFAAGFFMVKNAVGRGEHYHAKLRKARGESGSRWYKFVHFHDDVNGDILEHRTTEINNSHQTRGKQAADPILHIGVGQVITRAAWTRSADRSAHQALRITKEMHWILRDWKCMDMCNYLITPHLFIRPFSSTTILPDRWSSMYSNSLI